MSSDFQHPELHLARSNALTLASVVSATSDLALVINAGNTIDDLAHNLDRASGSAVGAWRGLPIEDVVRSGSRTTLHTMLRTARSGRPAQRFDISHVMDGGRDLPVRYTALGIGADGQIVLAGRDLRPLGDLQSKLLGSRQTLELNARLQRQAEAQYRLLFETGADAMIMVDAATGKVREANPRAAALLGLSGPAMAGKRLSALFDKHLQADVQAVLAGVLASGTPVALSVGGGEGRLHISADLFRAGDLSLVLVRLRSEGRAQGDDAAAELNLDSLVREAPEAVVLTDDTGAVVWANESFLALAGVPLAAHAVGRPLDAFFDWSPVELDVLLQNVRRHGRVPAFAGTVKGLDGGSADVELSAVAMREGSPGFGFVMRPVAAQERAGGANSDLTRTAENLVEMIGRVPMKDLVRDTTDVIEKMCIEAALKLTGNNRASAARVLGLSRQALYLKIDRFGISAPDEAPEA